MKLKMYNVYDSKAEAYLTPFFTRSRGEALRSWETAVNDPKTNFAKYPADYTLFEIGEYDESTGRCEMLPTLHSLGVALEYMKFNEGKQQFTPRDIEPVPLQKGAI